MAIHLWWTHFRCSIFLPEKPFVSSARQGATSKVRRLVRCTHTFQRHLHLMCENSKLLFGSDSVRASSSVEWNIFSFIAFLLDGNFKCYKSRGKSQSFIIWHSRGLSKSHTLASVRHCYAEEFSCIVSIHVGGMSVWVSHELGHRKAPAKHTEKNVKASKHIRIPRISSDFPSFTQFAYQNGISRAFSRKPRIEKS